MADPKEGPKIIFPAGSNIDDVFKVIEKLQGNLETRVFDELLGLVKQVAEGTVKGDMALLDAISDLGEKIFDQLEKQAKVINGLTVRVNTLEELLKTKIH